MFRNKKNSLLAMSLLLLTLILVACGENNENNINQTDNHVNDHLTENNPIVTIVMDNDEEIILELYPNIAPNTVKNFISLIENDFYNGLRFHRVIPDFMIQGGDPEGNGTGGPGYSIKGEFNSNGFTNELAHERGIISMARSQHNDSAGSQFFIMVDNATHLDGDYAAFGKVIEGMDVVDRIVSVNSDDNDLPLEDQNIKQMSVNTKGITYDEPEKQ